MLTLTARNGSSVLPDITPYLDAPMHVFVIAADAPHWSGHLHGMVAADMMQGEGCEAHEMMMLPAAFASPVRAHNHAPSHAFRVANPSNLSRNRLDGFDALSDDKRFI